MLDGLNNQVVQIDAVPDEAPVGSDSNYYGNGFHNKKTLYKTAKQAVADYDGRTGRVWGIENPNKKNAYSGANVGYKMGESDRRRGKLEEAEIDCAIFRGFSLHSNATSAVPEGIDGLETSSLGPSQREYAQDLRSTDISAEIYYVHQMFVTPYAEEQIFPSGVHINQHPGGDDLGLAEWVDKDASIENKDVVLWASFGMTHFARPEEFPIMPVEHLRIHLKPSSFFLVSGLPV